MRIKNEEIRAIMDAHQIWLADPEAPLGQRADLTGLDLRHWDFSNHRYRNIICEQTNFAGCDLSGLDFFGSDMRECDFRGTDISNTNFTGVSLCRSDFGSATIYETVFLHANVKDVEMRGAKVLRADFIGANFNEIATTVGSVFTECQFSRDMIT